MITLSEFILKLQKLEKEGHGNKLIALWDWAEGYEEPSISIAGNISVGKANIWHGPMLPWGRRSEGDFEEVDVILIGYEDD